MHNLATAMGFKNLDTTPESQEPLRLLEEKEARLRDLYGRP